MMINMGRQTDLVLDYGFPRVRTCTCNVKCPVLLEGVIKCCFDCIKYKTTCHTSCERLGKFK